jgi:transposase InsO family protein
MDTEDGNGGLSGFLPREWLPKLVEEYEKDPFFAGITDFLRGHKQSREVTSQVRSRAKTLIIDAEGVLFSTAAGGQPRLALPTGSVRDRLLKAFHEHLVHPDATRQRNAMCGLFFIPRATQTFRVYARKCSTCARSKHMTTAPGFSNATWTPKARWACLSMDLATGLRDEARHDSALVVCDLLTKRVVLVPVSRTANSTDIILALQRHVFLKHGVPLEINSDRGSQFTSREFQGFCKENRIQQTFTTRNHHAAISERVIRTCREKLRAATNGTGDQWHDALARVEWAINMTPSPLDGLCPFQRDTGYLPRWPSGPADLAAAATVQEGIVRSAATLPCIIDSFHQGKEASAAIHDKGRQEAKVAVGSWVHIDSKSFTAADERRFNSKFAKTRFVFSKPYRVTADKGHGNWELAMPEDFRGHPVFHHSILKVGAAPSEDSEMEETEDEL